MMSFLSICHSFRFLFYVSLPPSYALFLLLFLLFSLFYVFLFFVFVFYSAVADDFVTNK